MLSAFLIRQLTEELGIFLDQLEISSPAGELEIFLLCFLFQVNELESI